MRLLHYSAVPLLGVHHSTQDGERQRGRADKPNGLWVSVEGEDDWPTWCRAEGYGLNRLTVVTEVVLSPDANILRLATADEVRALGKRYPYHGHCAWSRGINWARVASDYHGIIIAPYQWDCRLSSATDWYYTWDCASGCIWDAWAVAALCPVVADAMAVSA